MHHLKISVCLSIIKYIQMTTNYTNQIIIYDNYYITYIVTIAKLKQRCIKL